MRREGRHRVDDTQAYWEGEELIKVQLLNTQHHAYYL